MKLHFTAKPVLFFAAGFGCLVDSVQGRPSTTTAESSSAPAVTTRPNLVCHPFFDGELRRRGGPSLNVIPGFNDLQQCPANCLYDLVSFDASSPAAQCSDYTCLCHNTPSGLACLSSCYLNFSTIDSTDLPSITSIFSVYCATTPASPPASTSATTPASTTIGTGSAGMATAVTLSTVTETSTSGSAGSSAMSVVDVTTSPTKTTLTLHSTVTAPLSAVTNTSNNSPGSSGASGLSTTDIIEIVIGICTLIVAIIGVYYNREQMRAMLP